MNKLFSPLFLSGILFLQPLSAQSSASSKLQEKEACVDSEESFVFFTPPQGWNLVEKKLLPPHVTTMVVGKAPLHFPPSINLSSEPFKGTLKDYLKIVKEMNTAQGYEWKDLGSIRTEAGSASLSQVDTKTQWGNVRLMHVIQIKYGKIYILTASALANEFSIFYKDFFTSMRSLKVVRNLYETVPPQQAQLLKLAVEKLESSWKILLQNKESQSDDLAVSALKEKTFNDEEFQNATWKPFQEMLNQKYEQLGVEWRSFFLQQLKNQLFNVKS